MSGHRQAISGDKITIFGRGGEKYSTPPVTCLRRVTPSSRHTQLYTVYMYRYRPPTALPPLPKNIINKYEIMSYTYTQQP